MDIKPGTMVLFKNGTKKTEKHPDMKGEASCTCEHCGKETHLEVVLWGKESKTGKPYLTGKITKYIENEYNAKQREAEEVAKAERAKPVDERADGLPF